VTAHRPRPLAIVPRPHDACWSNKRIAAAIVPFACSTTLHHQPADVDWQRERTSHPSPRLRYGGESQHRVAALASPLLAIELQPTGECALQTGGAIRRQIDALQEGDDGGALVVRRDRLGTRPVSRQGEN
jgi:hypothetical protein